MSSNSPEMSLRPLSPMEMFSYTRHQLGIYRAVVVTAHCVFPSNVSAITVNSPDLLYAALAIVLAKHPMLRVGLTDEPGSKPSYCYLPQVELMNHISFIDTIPQDRHDAHVDKLVGEHHDRTFDHISTVPPWRLTWAPNTQTGHVDVLFSFHHSLCGGTGGAVFHQDLLAALNSVLGAQPSQEVSSVLEFPDRPTVPRPQEEVINFTLSFFFLVSTIVSAILLPKLPAFLRPRQPRVFTGKEIDYSLPYITKVRSRDLSATQLAGVLRECKVRAVTLTALIHALCAASLAGQISPDLGLLSDTPISLEPFLPASEREDGVSKLRVLLSTVDHTFSPQVVAQLGQLASKKKELSPASDDSGLRESFDDTIWKHGATVKADILARLASLPRDDVTFMLNYISDWDAYWRGKEGQKRDSTFSVSNVGVFQNPPPPASAAAPEPQEAVEDGAVTNSTEPSEAAKTNPASPIGVKATRLLFTNASMVAGPAIGINLASVKGEGFTFAVTWQEGVVQDEMAERLGRDVVSWLGRLAETGKFG